MEDMRMIAMMRRVDDLGRLVIPKAMRERLAISTGEFLEVSLEDDKIILRKTSYIPINAIELFDQQIQEHMAYDIPKLCKIREHVNEIRNLLKEEKHNVEDNGTTNS